MTPQDMERLVVRFGDLKPCKTAFIDAHTPGSDQKENFAIIGGGVSESPEQHVHLRTMPGFNIGAAGQPPRCRNSLHMHRTAEVFFVHKGRWRFFWGLHGTAGEVVLEEGDLFNIPTGIFRGFENIGTDYGMIMAILGGDDAGGGVVWAPHVIDDARAHGLILSESGRLYDTRRGQSLPPGEQPMPVLSEAALQAIPELPVQRVVPEFVARYQDMRAWSAHAPARVIGADHALIRDRPGFELDLISNASQPAHADGTGPQHVLMVHRGHWRLAWTNGEVSLAPGDVAAVPAGLAHRVSPTIAGEAALFRVRATQDPAGPTRHRH